MGKNQNDTTNRSPLLIPVLAFAIILGLHASHVSSDQASETSDQKNAGVRLVLLGTAGGPIIQTSRAQPATLLLVDDWAYLIDAGESVNTQLAKAGYSALDLKSVFITHHHLDHIAGLGNVLAFRWMASVHRPGLPILQIVGPLGTDRLVQAAAEYMSTAENIFRAQFPMAPELDRSFVPSEIEAGLVYKDDKVRVRAVENTHFNQLVFGNKIDESTYKSFSYRFETAYGSVVFSGDTGPSEDLLELSEDADILVAEVINVPKLKAMIGASANIPPALQQEQIQIVRRKHLTPQDVGTLAATANVKKVVLTHFSSIDDNKSDESYYLDGIAQKYSGHVVVGRDLLVVPVE
ncbi:MBL fold metallo-hydrolase [Kineobactrum salinum]|uniref:MBL fold metallo-hydrolase n=1 Tax=Kineobactrum salinum TaxID=2708301 RepID=A0A6C0TZ23_9GAMM|nr:MBL fold metallo-hydrolase [Kineobactrum salinum]QIB65070.1 MBL fold metallo-hydrolase [Kineobactrum salinum]